MSNPFETAFQAADLQPTDKVPTGKSLQDFIDGGWSPRQLVQHGYAVRTTNDIPAPPSESQVPAPPNTRTTNSATNSATTNQKGLSQFIGFTRADGGQGAYNGIMVSKKVEEIEDISTTFMGVPLKGKKQLTGKIGWLPMDEETCLALEENGIERGMAMPIRITNKNIRSMGPDWFWAEPVS